MQNDHAGSEHLPPQDRAAERAVLGAMLRDNGVISDIAHVLRPDHFYLFAHAKIYEGILHLFLEQNNPADLVTVADYLKEKHLVEDAGGYPCLMELYDAAPCAANAQYYAAIVREKSIFRQLYQTGMEIARIAMNPSGPAEEVVSEAEKLLFQISQASRIGGTVTIQDAMKEEIERLDPQAKEKAKASLSTGLFDLDNITGGLHNSELIVIAARPSLGKTSLALNILDHAVLNEKVPVFLASIEQRRTEVAGRLLCAEAKVNAGSYRNGLLSASDYSRLTNAAKLFAHVNFHIDDGSEQTMLMIAANARRLKMRPEGLRLVVVDYLQLIESSNCRENRQEQVAAISRRLKLLARELETPVIALAQLNRGAEDHQQPRLADLRDSGAIEQDADVCIFLWRPEKDLKEKIVVTVAKQRNGPIDDLYLHFDGEFMRFENFAYE